MVKKKYILLAAVAIVAASCSKMHSGDSRSLTLRVGYEQETQPVTKTYVRDSNAGTIWWGTSNQDKVIYAFDASENKFSFTSTSTTAEATRAFTCDSWSGGDWKMVIWSGLVEANDHSTLSGSVLSGSSLKVMNPQKVNNSKSFDSRANIAVMKPGDTALRNVFGYLRFTLPSYPIPGETRISAIKSVTLTADENVAGNICIDYSGTDPVATVVSNGSTSLTLNARWKDNGPTGYEAGVVYMILPPGTYHHASLTLVPFTEEPTVSGAATGTPFTVNFVGDVVVQRGKYTECGVLPASEGQADEGITAGGEGYQWSGSSNCTVFLAGDSTCAPSESLRPKWGWGEKLGAYLCDGVSLENKAVGGKSTKTFISGGQWNKMLNLVASGDVVLIQFGHNDENQTASDERGTTPEQFYTNLCGFISDVKGKGAVPVILTPLCRRSFTNGLVDHTHGEYLTKAKQAATDNAVVLLDIEQRSYEWLTALGEDASIPRYMVSVDPYNDNTHLTELGAAEVAQMVATALAECGNAYLSALID